MIRDISFLSSENLDLPAVPGREYIGLLSADVDGDGIAEIIVHALNGDFVLYKDSALYLSYEGLHTSSVCAFQVIENFICVNKAKEISHVAAIVQLYCCGTLTITSLKCALLDEKGDSEPHKTAVFDHFPRNATQMKSFCLSDGRRILIICACSELKLYRYDESDELFDLLQTIATESDVNSIDFVENHFLLFGLRAGGILIFDVILEAKHAFGPASEDGQEPTKEVNLVLKRVPVLPGFEPPLRHHDASGSSAESFVKGYVTAVAVTPHVGDRSIAAVHTMESVESFISQSPSKSVHFCIAWADGRICLCDIISQVEPSGSPIADVADDDLSSNYFWRTVRCVQTGLYLFSVECVHLQKNVETNSGVVSGDDVLCIVASRTGQTFFVSTADYSDFKCEMNGNDSRKKDALPPTVCCFEGSTLLATAPSNDITSSIISKEKVEDMFLSGTAVMVRAFTSSFKAITRKHDIAVASLVESVPIARKEQIECIAEDDLSQNSNTNTTIVVGELSSTAVGSLPPGVILEQTLPVDDEIREPVVPLITLADVQQSEPTPLDFFLNLWYLTGDGKLKCIPKVASQFLSFGAGLTSTSIEESDIEFVKDTLIRWMLAPHLVPFDFAEELMDLVFEYFQNIASILSDAVKAGAKDMNRIINGKTVAEHMTLFFLNELSVAPTQDITNFTKDLRELVDNY